MSLQESVNKLQNIKKISDNYSISVSPSLKGGQLQYQLKNNGYIEYVGVESEINAFIDGVVHSLKE